MKKFFATILALVLVVAMSTISAFAAEGEEKDLGNGSEVTIDVGAKFSSEVNTETKYSVDVAWGAMEFTYSVAGTKEWDAENHVYITNTDANWSASGNEITVTNHSNTDITATLTYAAETGFEALTYSFEESSDTANDGVLSLATADNGVDGAAGTATTATAKLVLGGTLADTVTSITKVGTITVKIS